MLGLALALALQVIISLFLVAWTKTRVRKELDAGSELARVRRELGALMAEMDASADRNVTILEDRLNSLKELVGEADRRIALSARESGRRKAEGTLRAAMERDAYAPVLPDQLPAAERQAENPSPKPTPRAEPKPEPKPEPPQAAAAPPSSSPKGDIPFIRFSDKPVIIEPPFEDKVSDLAKRGFSSDLIAARLGSTLSEVELALALSAAREQKGL